MRSQGRFGRKLATALGHVRARFTVLWLVFAALLIFGVTGAAKVSFDDALLRSSDQDELRQIMSGSQPRGAAMPPGAQQRPPTSVR